MFQSEVINSKSNKKSPTNKNEFTSTLFPSLVIKSPKGEEEVMETCPVHGGILGKFPAIIDWTNGTANILIEKLSCCKTCYVKRGNKSTLWLRIVFSCNIGSCVAEMELRFSGKIKPSTKKSAKNTSPIESSSPDNSIEKEKNPSKRAIPIKNNLINIPINSPQQQPKKNNSNSIGNSNSNLNLNARPVVIHQNNLLNNNYISHNNNNFNPNFNKNIQVSHHNHPSFNQNNLQPSHNYNQNFNNNTNHATTLLRNGMIMVNPQFSHPILNNPILIQPKNINPLVNGNNKRMHTESVDHPFYPNQQLHMISNYNHPNLNNFQEMISIHNPQFISNNSHNNNNNMQQLYPSHVKIEMIHPPNMFDSDSLEEKMRNNFNYLVTDSPNSDKGDSRKNSPSEYLDSNNSNNISNNINNNINTNSNNINNISNNSNNINNNSNTNINTTINNGKTINNTRGGKTERMLNSSPPLLETKRTNSPPFQFLDPQTKIFLNDSPKLKEENIESFFDSPKISENSKTKSDTNYFLEAVSDFNEIKDPYLNYESLSYNLPLFQNFSAPKDAVSRNNVIFSGVFPSRGRPGSRVNILLDNISPTEKIYVKFGNTRVDVELNNGKFYCFIPNSVGQG